MKCRSDSSGGGDDRRIPAAAATGDGCSGETSKKRRTEEPSSSSSGAGECSSTPASASVQAPPPPTQREQSGPDAREGEGEQPPVDADAGGEGEQERVPDLGEDLLFEVLMRAEARTLASAACVSRGWRQLARDERLWEAACVREWANLGFSEQMLRMIVLSFGGFRRLYVQHIRPVQLRAAGVPPGQRRGQVPVRLGRDQVQVSLSLLSTSFFLNMPNAPPPEKDKDNDKDKNGGGQCG
ncbi:hypothetical protein HU200_062466 [Digitaria exilis]|uniref:F-box protein GID2 n=1 Tax=Digitaria exilis TaxID=1010633 RepID=A0A835DYA8_9POAL|nr:hypothetical protein HU200_062466 [Digitaria exilis]